MKTKNMKTKNIVLKLCFVFGVILFFDFIDITNIIREPVGISITNCYELQNMRDNLDGDYYLANNIDCSNTVNWNFGAGFESVGNSDNKFTGTFDGKGYMITDLYINRGCLVGLFGCVSGSEIKNVGLERVNVIGVARVGSLVGDNRGTITNSYATGNVIGGNDHTGGLVGISYRGTVINSYSTTVVSGINFVGGLVGYNYGTITNSYATGDIIASGDYVGGLVGYNRMTISNSYSTGVVSGTNSVGGLVGKNYHIGTTIKDSYWDTETSGQATSAGGTGKTTAEMKQQATFVDWNFNNLWEIEETIIYPYFIFEWQEVSDIIPDVIPPEAIIRFNSETKDIAVVGIGDKLDEDVDVFSKEVGKQRSYTLADDANNRLELIMDYKAEGKEIKIELIGADYYIDNELSSSKIFAKNHFKFKYSENKDGTLKDLKQEFDVKKEFYGSAKYDFKKDETDISIKQEDEKKQELTKQGLWLIEGITNNGEIEFNAP